MYGSTIETRPPSICKTRYPPYNIYNIYEKTNRNMHIGNMILAYNFYTISMYGMCLYLFVKSKIQININTVKIVS